MIDFVLKLQIILWWLIVIILIIRWGILIHFWLICCSKNCNFHQMSNDMFDTSNKIEYKVYSFKKHFHLLKYTIFCMFWLIFWHIWWVYEVRLTFIFKLKKWTLLWTLKNISDNIYFVHGQPESSATTTTQCCHHNHKNNAKDATILFTLLRVSSPINVVLYGKNYFIIDYWNNYS